MRGLSGNHFAMSFREISRETGLPVREVRRLYYSAIRKMCRFTHRTIVAEILLQHVGQARSVFGSETPTTSSTTASGRRQAEE